MNAGRFAKGRSGNPKGRARKAVPAGSAFDIVMDRELEVLRDGVAHRLTVEEALQWRTYQEAVAGNASARNAVLRMIARREKAMPKLVAGPVYETLFEREPDNADAALLILGIATPDPAQPAGGRKLLLEPWAVQAAITRGRTGALNADNLATIRGSTRDGEDLTGLEAQHD